jgi:type II secretory pathway pseudopilin PulG
MRSPVSRTYGFSLVEVVIAIGIVSFAILGVIGLLPVGLKTVRNANEEAGAANVLNGIAEAVRNAAIAATNSGNPPGLYSNSYAGQSITFTNGGTSTNCLWTNLTLEGIATNDFGKRLSAVLNFTPPSTNLATNGCGTVSVAWSAQANPIWINNTQTWTNTGGSIDGYLTIGFRFLPR